MGILTNVDSIEEDDCISLDEAMERFIRTYHYDMPLKDETFDDELLTHSCQHLIIDNKSLELLKQGWQITLPAMG